jgi:hypothetical protein
LEGKNWILPKQKVTNTQLAAILLSLVTTLGPHKASDKIPDTVTNVIKVVAYLLEDATVAKYIEKIMHQITDLKILIDAHQPANETMSHINNMLTNIHNTVCKQTEAIQKTSETLEKIQANRIAATDIQQQHLPY